MTNETGYQSKRLRANVKTGHTPGEWAVFYGNRHDKPTTISGPYGVICTMPQERDTIPSSDAWENQMAHEGQQIQNEIQANARLIAAAPELLEAVEDLLATRLASTNPRHVTYETAEAKAKAVLAKVRG